MMTKKKWKHPTKTTPMTRKRKSDDLAAGEPAAGPIHVHVDVDVVDPAVKPAVNYPAPGGPGLEEVGAALRRLAATGRVVAASFSSWNPELDGAEAAADGDPTWGLDLDSDDGVEGVEPPQGTHAFHLDVPSSAVPLR